MSVPNIVQRYEEMLRNGESIYLDPIDLDEIYHYYAEQNQLDKVEDVLRIGLTLHPDDAIIMQMDAEYTLNMGDASEALEKIDRIFTEDNPFLCILRSAAFARLHKKAEALAMAQAALVNEDPHEYIAYDLGIGFMNGEDYITALHFYQRSLKNHPDDVKTLSGMLYCYVQLAEIDKVAETADEILKIDPFHFDAWISKGDYLFEKELYAEAIDAYDYAAAILPEETNPLVLKARCLDSLDKKDEAISLLQEVTKRPGSDMKSIACLFLANLLHEQQRDEEAKDAIWLSIEGHEKDVNCILRAAFEFQDIGKHKEAINLFEQANELQPNDPSLLTSLAENYAFEERYNDAADAYKQVCQLAPSMNSYALWAGIMMSLGKFGAAYKLLRQANQIEEAYQTYVLMAVCDAEMKHYKKMEEDFRYAYALCPDSAFHLLQGFHPQIATTMEENGFIDELEQERQERIHRKEEELRLKAENTHKQDTKK